MLIWFGDEHASRETAFGFNQLARCIEHGHFGPTREKTRADVPAAGRADEIDVGENHVDDHVGFAYGDRLFTARGLDNDVTGFPEFVGNPASH